MTMTDVKRTTKVRKTITGGLIVIIGVLMFGLGALANATWKTYDGNVAQSEDHVDEIMEILRDVNADKLSAEDALASLEALNPAGLAKLNKELRERVKQLEDELSGKVTELANRTEELANKQREIDEKNREINDKNKIIEGKDVEVRELTQINEELGAYVKHLEAEIAKANEAVEGLNGKTQDAIDEARGIAK